MLYIPVNTFRSCQDNFQFSLDEPGYLVDKLSCSITQDSGLHHRRILAILNVHVAMMCHAYKGMSLEEFQDGCHGGHVG